MSRELIIRDEAEADLAEARDFYDGRRPGLGTAFLGRVDAALEHVLRFPLASKLVFEDVRRVLLKQFPYGIFYHVGDAQITVIAVYHLRRDPRGWQARR